MKGKGKKSKITSPAGELPVHHLLPFVMLVGVSFTWFLPKEPTLQNMVLKCLPVLYLILYLAFTEKGKGDSKTVLPALIFSVIGDGFLAFPETKFVEGLVAFAVAQILYTITFGFKKIRLQTGIALYGAVSLLLYFILPNVPVYLKFAIPMYAVLISTMIWRAADRYAFATHMVSEQRLCTLLGAITFIISDTCIVFLQLFKLIPHIPAQVIILITYYTAQVLLTLGSAPKFWDSRRVVKYKK